MADRRKTFEIVISALDKASKPLNQTRRRIAGIGKKMQSVGRQMSLGLTAPIAAAAGFTIRAAADFEASMNRVKGVTEATQEEFDSLNDLAKKLGRTTQFSASQAADAMEAMGKAGFSTTEILDGLPAVLELAAASSVELGEAGKLASGMLKGFGGEAKDLSRFNDKMVTANIRTLTSLDSITEALKEVAPFARSAGIDFGEMAAVAGFMGDALLEGGRGGVAMKNIIMRLQNATPQVQRVLANLKVDKKAVIDSTGQITSLVAVIEELERVGAEAPDIGLIFGQRAAPAMLSLLNTGSAALRQLRDEINSEARVGEAQRQAEIRMAGATGAMLEFKSAVEGLQIAIGDSGLLGTFTSVTKSLTRFIQGLAEASPRGLKFGTIIALLVAIVGPLIVLIGLVTAAIATISAPVLIVIGAIAGLIAAAAALMVWWEPVKEFFVELGQIFVGVGKGFLILVKGIVDGIGSVFSAIASAPGFLLEALGLGGPATELAGAGVGGLARPPAGEVNGLIGVKIESDQPARVTTLETSGEVEIDVDSGPGMSGF